MTSPPADPTTRPAGVDAAVSEVVALASELIALDTTNLADPTTLGTERAAAEYVAEKLADVGYEVSYVESGARAGAT